MKIALLFEVTPKPDAFDEYLAIAASLRPELDASGGCLFIDRFRCVREPRRILSFQIWRDEASLVRWRVNTKHHSAQVLGRTRIFDDYRLRITQVIHEQTVDGQWRPDRLNTYNDPKVRVARYLTIAESKQPIENGELYESLYRDGEFACVADVENGADMGAGSSAPAMRGAFRVRLCETERDYGMYERAEAPQFCPALQRHV